MGLFKKGNSGGKRPVSDWVILAGIALLVLTVIVAPLINMIFGSELYFGPAFLLLAIIASLFLALAFSINVLKRRPMEKKDVLAMVIVFIITALAVVFLRDLVPEIFKPGAIALQSLIIP